MAKRIFVVGFDLGRRVRVRAVQLRPVAARRAGSKMIASATFPLDRGYGRYVDHRLQAATASDGKCFAPGLLITRAIYSRPRNLHNL